MDFFFFFFLSLSLSLCKYGEYGPFFSLRKIISIMSGNRIFQLEIWPKNIVSWMHDFESTLLVYEIFNNWHYHLPLSLNKKHEKPHSNMINAQIFIKAKHGDHVIIMSNLYKASGASWTGWFLLLYLDPPALEEEKRRRRRRRTWPPLDHALALLAKWELQIRSQKFENLDWQVIIQKRFAFGWWVSGFWWNLEKLN